jgi:hypothetical protein
MPARLGGIGARAADLPTRLVTRASYLSFLPGMPSWRDLCGASTCLVPAWRPPERLP